ncbi:hypothetical protein [Vagococcus intermedius]|uniref:Uncharacterized protein n=1 Tax=Vagococcus intermedius TaxID=2991418 RepID=A0AAF0CUQ4_9ENTE|nr:hypothetical protein [Vagococcus intermedius]WEG73072.1 hypothetical protein OL234_08895 [Vagococcus intermedius]WEG75156.1 hypothetical protein OL235_08890 [Vagococcus intermedius]
MMQDQLKSSYQDYTIYYDQREVTSFHHITSSQEILVQKKLGLQGDVVCFQGPVELVDIENKPFPHLTFPTLAEFKHFFREYDVAKANKLEGTARAFFLQTTYNNCFPSQVEYRQVLLILAAKLGVKIRKYRLEGLGDTFGCEVNRERLESLISDNQPLVNQTFNVMVDRQGNPFPEEISEQEYQQSDGKYEAVVTDKNELVGEAYFSDITSHLFRYAPFTSNYGEALYQILDSDDKVVSPYVVEADLLGALIRYQNEMPTLSIAERSISYVPVSQMDLGEMTQVTDFDEQSSDLGTEKLTDLYLLLDDDWANCEKHYYCSMEAFLYHNQYKDGEYGTYEKERQVEWERCSYLVEQALVKGYQIETQWQRICKRWNITSVEGVLHDLEKLSVVLAPAIEPKDELIFCVKNQQGEVLAQQLTEADCYRLLGVLTVR